MSSHEGHADPGGQHGTTSRVGRRGVVRLWLYTHGPTVGLVAVLVLLAAFSVSAAVRNANAADQAQLSGAVSRWSEAAERSLLAEEEASDDLSESPEDPELLAEYEAARAATRAALVELGAVEGMGHEGLVGGWLSLHDRYGVVVQDLLRVARTDLAAADAYEDTYVDPHYDAVEEVVQREGADHVDDADVALMELGQEQEVLLVATVALFAVGLALVAWFTTVLTRTRRETAAQVEVNRRQALHDALTGLPNRTLLRQRAEAALRETGPTALMLIDLDRFKQINDTLGHAHGDLVLQAVADRVQAALRSTDTVARLGGDEFAVLLPSVADGPAALELAARAQAALSEPVFGDGVRIDVSASIGIALSGQHGTDVETLLHSADVAMYSAKTRGVGVCLQSGSAESSGAGRPGAGWPVPRTVVGSAFGVAQPIGRPVTSAT